MRYELVASHLIPNYSAAEEYLSSTTFKKRSKDAEITMLKTFLGSDTSVTCVASCTVHLQSRYSWNYFFFIYNRGNFKMFTHKPHSAAVNKILFTYLCHGHLHSPTARDINVPCNCSLHVQLVPDLKIICLVFVSLLTPCSIWGLNDICNCSIQKVFDQQPFKNAWAKIFVFKAELRGRLVEWCVVWCLTILARYCNSFEQVWVLQYRSVLNITKQLAYKNIL